MCLFLSTIRACSYFILVRLWRRTYMVVCDYYDVTCVLEYNNDVSFVCRMAKDKLNKKHKTQEERIAIVDTIKTKFQETLGLNIDAFESEALQKFNVILNEYASSKTLLSGFTGRMYIPELGRYIEYILPLTKHVKENVGLVTS